MLNNYDCDILQKYIYQCSLVNKPCKETPFLNYVGHILCISVLYFSNFLLLIKTDLYTNINKLISALAQKVF